MYMAVEPSSPQATSTAGTTAQTTVVQPSQQASRQNLLRFGVIGYGYWGPQLVRNLDRLVMGRVEIIADLSAERRQVAQFEHPGSLIARDVGTMLESDVDAVIVATPIRTHYQLAKAALEHGKHVFVEKPLTASSVEAEELIALAAERDLRLMVGHTFMYHPAVEMMRQLVQSEELGRIYYVDAVRANLGLFQPDINVLWDLAPHDLSILDYVLGTTPLRVTAHGGAYIRPDVHDVAHLTLYYPQNVLAHLHTSWLSPAKIRRFTVVGDKKMVIYDDVEATEKIRVFNRGIDKPDHTSTFGEFQLSYRYGDIVSPHIHWAEPLAQEARHFAESILEGWTPRSDGANGLRIVRILEAADASLAAGGIIIEIV
jgi:predicted dehydrogenase